MKRSELVATIKSLISIDFFHSFVYRINEYKGGYPVWLLTPPKMVSKQKRGKEYVTEYHCESFLFEKNNQSSEDEKELIWQGQEDLATAVYSALDDLSRSDSDIKSVSNLICEPDEFQIDQRGSISTRVVFNVQIYHCES